MNEKQIESTILTWLNYQPGIYAFKINTTGIYDPSKNAFRKNRNPFVVLGASDILGIVRGRFLAIEVKTPATIRRFKNYPNESDLRQKEFLNRITYKGGIAMCVSSVEEVIEYFKNLSH